MGVLGGAWVALGVGMQFLTQVRRMLVLSFPSRDLSQRLHKRAQPSGFTEDKILQSHLYIHMDSVDFPLLSQHSDTGWGMKQGALQ